MSIPARRLATYEDILQAPRDKVAEILRGALHVHPRPAKPHAAAASALGEELGPPFKRGRGGPGGWILLDEPEIHFAADVLVPDLAGWRRARLPVLTNDEPFFTIRPDWICEVISPSTERLDRTEKMSIYLEHAVPHAWLVNPLARTLEAFRFPESRWLLLGSWADAARVRVEPFDAIELDLSLLWADVDLG